MTRKCARWDCMIEFEPKSYNQIYHSTECSEKAVRDRTAKRALKVKNHKKQLEYFTKRGSYA